MQKAQLKTCAPSLLHTSPHTHTQHPMQHHTYPHSHFTLPPLPSSFIHILTPTPNHSSTHTFTPQPAFFEKSRTAAGGEAVRRWGQPVLGGEKEAPRAHSLTVAESCPGSSAGEGVEAVGEGAKDQGVHGRGREGGAVGVGAKIRASPRYPRAESAPPAPASEMLTRLLCPQG